MKETYLPRARTDRLVVKELSGEVLVYDQERDKAHCLNPAAAAIWKECDGLSTATEIARVRRIDEQLVWLALEQLSKDHLLTEQVSWPSALPHMSRREALRHVGLGAAIALPIVATIVAPTAVQAGSCKGTGASCGTGSQCCSGVCSGGSCLGGPLNRQERSRHN